MDGAITTDTSELNVSSMVTEISGTPNPVNSPSSSEQEVNNEMSLDTNTEQSIDTEELIGETDNTEENVTNNASCETLENGDCNKNEAQISRSKSSSKSVSFPPETLVMGFLEPPDPWKNAPPWQTEDLMKAYKSSCEKHGTKPLSKIMQQLQCIENVGERYEILSLKGERLDMKQCESLEEIFKRVRFRCVDFEATHLDDEMAVAIFEMVEYYESACKLNISFNKTIGPRGWQSCARLVRKTPCLTFIDARNCDLNERVIPIIGRSLRMGCYLQRLQLQSVNLAGRALVILVAALKMNEILKELFLGDNKLMPTDGVQLGNLLKFNHKLELLDLRNNHLQDVGAGHIFDGLSEQNLDTGLLTLVLWSNQITFQAMTSVNKALTTAANLETLNLGHNPITNEGIHLLKDGLLKSRSLMKLGLSGTKVTCEGAVALAEFIADSHKLVRLDLQENDIKTAGMMALSLALKMNDSLTRLELDRDTKKESGVKDYVQQQKRLQQEITTLLERNRDIAHQLSEKKRKTELQNQENARKLEEAAKDIESSESMNEYIPSEDTIHRPKLLFIPNLTPQHELDSPVGDELIQTSNPLVPHLTLANAGSDLLSPQYCPNPKATAKKLFSVTRVLSPTLSSPVSEPASVVTNIATASILNTTVNLPVPQLCPPIPELQGFDQTLAMSAELSPVSPSTIQKVIEEHTLVSYIQQIISDSSNQMTTSEPCDGEKESEEKTIGTDGNKSELNREKGDSLNISHDIVDKDIDGIHSNNTIHSGKDGDVDLKSTEIVEECSDSDANNSNRNSDDISTVCDGDKQLDGNDCDKNSADIPERDEAQDELADSESLTFAGAEKDESSDGDSGNTNSDSYPTVDNNSVPDASQDVAKENIGAESKEDLEGNGEFVDCLAIENGSEINSNGDFKDHQVPAGVADNEEQATLNVEQWNTVNKTDILDNESGQVVDVNSDDNANTRKPDFYTNLSMNGLKQELASLIDDEGNPTTPAVQLPETEGANNSEELKTISTDLATDWIDATTSLDTNSS